MTSNLSAMSAVRLNASGSIRPARVLGRRRPPDELVDLGHHPHLVLPAEDRALLENDLDALARAVAAELPALEGGAQESGGEWRVPGEPVGPREDAVLEHRGAFLVEIDHHEVVRLHAGVEGLLVLVVRRGGRRVDSLLEL